MKSDCKLIKTLEIPVRWSDMDAVGHVNNSRYFTYCEQVRVEWMSELNYRVSAQDPTGPVIINASLNFLKPIHFPATVIIKLYAGVPGRSSMMTYYEMSLVDSPETIYADGSSKVVWVDYATGKSTPLPLNVRKLL